VFDSVGKLIVCAAFEPGAGKLSPENVKVHDVFDDFMSPFPEKLTFTVQVPLLRGRTVIRGPRESSSVYSLTVQTLDVVVVNVIPLVVEATRPSVALTLASKNAPLTGTELGAMRLIRVP
jgi:hypothetical protein